MARAPGGSGNNGGSFLGVLKSTEYKEEAVAVVKWLMSPQNQLEYYLNLDLFPSIVETLESDELAQPDPFYGEQVVTDVFSESAQNVPNTYYGELYTKFHRIFSDEITMIERGNKDPELAWQDVQKKIERELSRQSY